MLNDMLEDYNKDEYVYIIEGCMDLYVSDQPANDEPCPVCGDYDWDYCEGYVSDILQAKDLDDLERIQLARHKSLEDGQVKKLVPKKN